MKEEVNEFYEEIYLQDVEETRDEAIRFKFKSSKRVVLLWKKVRRDALLVFPTRKIFLETFFKYHKKKLQKKSSKICCGLTPSHCF
jgi:hypothetical protein